LNEFRTTDRTEGWQNIEQQRLARKILWIEDLTGRCVAAALSVKALPVIGLGEFNWLASTMMG
jgi:hypothetical protein